MRLFIAINFGDNTKGAIQKIIGRVKESSIQGRFVQDDHMHLTLEFLGDISPNEIDIIKDVMDQVTAHPFTMQLSGIGFFRRREGDICWLGIEENESLYELQSRLHDGLREEGFQLESRHYKPHITIGRKVKLDNTINPKMLEREIKNITIDIDKIDLMKSQHINGKLVYSMVHTRGLE